jgi:hypothetical protein
MFFPVTKAEVFFCKKKMNTSFFKASPIVPNKNIPQLVIISTSKKLPCYQIYLCASDRSINKNRTSFRTTLVTNNYK